MNYIHSDQQILELAQEIAILEHENRQLEEHIRKRKDINQQEIQKWEHGTELLKIRIQSMEKKQKDIEEVLYRIEEAYEQVNEQ